jgi:hypothetical protein
MAAASIRTAGVFLVLVMILFTHVGGLLLAVGDPHPGHRAPARLTPIPAEGVADPLALRPGPSPCGFGSRPCDRWVV